MNVRKPEHLHFCPSICRHGMKTIYSILMKQDASSANTFRLNTWFIKALLNILVNFLCLYKFKYGGLLIL